MSAKPLVFVVDDDEAVRESITALLEASDYTVHAYRSAKAFLDDVIPPGACVVADIRMPEMDGLELQQEINKRDIGLPVIIITGHGDVSLAVRAMKAGALDFIEKPFDDTVILDAIKRAIEIANHTRSRSMETKAARQLLALLTPREQTVLEQLVAGRSNKVAAFELGISPRTIEIHRAHIMDKMNARSLSDLVRISLAAGSSGSLGTAA
jgi:two-component system response regulator FixJ